MRFWKPFLFVSAFFLVGCQTPANQAIQAKEPKPLIERLTFRSVVPASHESLLVLPAWVTTSPHFTYELSPPAEGVARRILVKEGSFVEANTALTELQIPSFTDWKAIEAAGQKRLDIASSQLKIEKEKFELGLKTTSDVQEAERAEAEALLALRQMQVMRRANQVSGLSNDASGTASVWRAPRAGVITKIHISEGMGLSPNMVAFSIADLSQVEVAVRIPERFLPMVTPETQLLWRPTGLPIDHPGYPLTFARNDAVLDSHSRTATWFFQGKTDASEVTSFLPGRSGKGTLMVAAPVGLWKVPRQAVCRLLDKTGVFVASTGQALPEFKEIELVGTHGDDLLVRFDAEPNTQVVVSGIFLLKSILLLGEES